MKEKRPKNEICPVCGSPTHDYGGGWSCNDYSCSCNSETGDGIMKLTPEWWNDGTKVYKDGDMWCAVKPDFINLQESPAGFGKTPREAVLDLR